MRFSLTRRPAFQPVALKFAAEPAEQESLRPLPLMLSSQTVSVRLSRTKGRVPTDTQIRPFEVPF